MEQGVGNQFFYLAAVILTGIISGFIYDVFRAKRRLIKSGKISINFEDILYLIIVGGIMLFVTYLHNSGEIRISGFAGMILGISLYFFILKNKMVNLLVKIIVNVKKLIILVVKILFLPVKIILRLFRKPVYIFCWVVGGKYKRFKAIVRVNFFKFIHRIKIINFFTKNK